MATRETPAARLPLTPRTFLVLWGLSDGPRHGYALLQRVEELARGQVSIGATSMYEGLYRLRDDGLVEEVAAPPGEDTDNRRRRFFRLTEGGRDVLEAEAERLAALVDDLRAHGLATRRS